MKVEDKERTLAGTEPKFAIFVKIGSRGTPWKAIRSSLGGAGGVRLAFKPEWKLTHGSFSVAKTGLDSCQTMTRINLNTTDNN